jgi:hypothetical protein
MIEVEFIAYDKKTVADDALDEVAHQVLIDAMKDVKEGHVADRRVVRNDKGFDFLESLSDQERTNRSLQRTTPPSFGRDELTCAIGRLAIIEATLENQAQAIEQLKAASIGYRKIRHRFIDTFKRDVQGYNGPDGRKRIYDGNVAAHHGDLVTDALLYSLRERDDMKTLEDLYGLSAPEIELLGKNRELFCQVL